MIQSQSKILIVEDDPALRSLLMTALGEAGFEVHVANHGLEAKSHGMLGSFDAVITDINMPGSEVDGFALLDYIRAKFPTVPVILMSGQEMFLESFRVLSFGANAILAKPFSFEELLSLLRVNCGVSADEQTRGSNVSVNTEGQINQEVLAFSKELNRVIAKAEAALSAIEEDPLAAREYFFAFQQWMLAIKICGEHLELAKIEEFAHLGEKIAVAAMLEDSPEVVRRSVRCLWDTLSTLKELLLHWGRDDIEMQKVLSKRLHQTLRALARSK